MRKRIEEQTGPLPLTFHLRLSMLDVFLCEDSCFGAVIRALFFDQLLFRLDSVDLSGKKGSSEK